MKNNTFLAVKDLSVSIFDKQVLKDVCLSIMSGSVHALMGPNGSGKSSLAYLLAGHPSYEIIGGEVLFKGQNLCDLAPYERARKGLFLSFQNPCEIPGVSVRSFLKEAYTAVKGVHTSVEDFNALLVQKCEQLSIDPLLLSRGLNEGFSGGEKKRLELLQMIILQPDVAILDEIDSGLDVDALKSVAAGIELARSENPQMSIILITHYRRILDYIKPDYVHILCAGSIVASGDHALVDVVESEGYDVFKR